MIADTSACDGAPLEILLHTLGLPIAGEDPVDLSLGGSETAVVSMARALSRLGHRVTLSCRTGEPCERGGIELVPAERLVEHRYGRSCDVFIAARDIAVLRKPVAARMYGTWHHDMPGGEWVRSMGPAFARAGFFLFVSRFQQQAFEDLLPLARLGTATTNGIDFEALEPIRETAARDESRPRFYFASRPERGLKFLLQEVWPALKKRLPEAELLVSSYSLDGLIPPERVREMYRSHDELIRRTPGVHPIGPLSRRAFWRELAACTAVLYPTDFPETSCMAALEAQALGVPVVTTGRYALRETVGFRETLICDPWRSPEYLRNFVATALRLVEDPAFARRARETGLRHVAPETHSWDAIAKTWQELFHRLFRERFERRKAGVLRRLLRDSDLAAARRLVAAEADPAGTFDPADLAVLRDAATGSAPMPSWENLPPQLTEVRRDLFALLEGEASGDLLCPGAVGAGLASVLARDHPGLRSTPVDGHDVALLCQVLETVEDPAGLLEWAESRARRGVAGYTLDGPWDPAGSERFRLHHLGERELRDLLGGKQGLELRYLRCGRTDRGEALGCWFFRYRTDPRNLPGRLDLDGKLGRTQPLPRISALLLVKNEEANLRRAISSLESIADEIVVGDTGSTDMTVQILESLGFQPGSDQARRWVSIPFEDFAQARNALSAHARGDYLLWQDADEALVHAPVLRELVDGNELFDGFRIEQRHLVLDFRLESDYPLRCFRPRTEEGPLQWTGCLHESVELRLNEPPRRVTICPEVYFAHLGFFHSELRQGKAIDRNWPLFLKDRRENPGRLAGYVLGIREYLLLARWEIGTAGRMTKRAYHCLNYGFEIWHRHVRHLPDSYRQIGFPLSRDILAVLARHKLPLRLTGIVPFQADLSLEIHPGDKPAPAAGRPRRWTFFADAAEVRQEIQRSLAEIEERSKRQTPSLLPLDMAEDAPELRSWTISPELFGLEPFE